MQPELKPVRTDDQSFGRGATYEVPQDVTAGADSPQFAQRVLRNTYMLLALTMVPTVIGAWVGIETSAIIMASPIISTVVMLAAVIGLQFAIARYRNSGVGVALLLLMTGLLGWWLGPILNVALSMKNGMALVGYAAVGTGVVFFGMGALAQTIKRDLSFMNKFLFVGMIALLIAMLANMFLQIPALALTISTLVIVVFSLFLLYDLQRIMRGGETNYVMATTGVYLSLFNIFANLLHLLLALAGEKD
jgi:FtsH-binding integral membrane protein